MAVNKRKRKTKVSKGEHGGAQRIHLTGLQRVLLGKGQVDSIEEVEVRQTFGRWMSDRQRIILGER